MLKCRVLRLLALALELPGGFFEERFAAPIANVRAVHYLQGQPSNPDQGIFGVGAQQYLHLLLLPYCILVYVDCWVKGSLWKPGQTANFLPVCTPSCSCNT